MKIQVRRGVFETNSSSVHTLTIAKRSEYENGKKVKLFLMQIMKNSFQETNS